MTDSMIATVELQNSGASSTAMLEPDSVLNRALLSYLCGASSSSAS